VYFGGPGAIENVRTGNLRALAVTTATRWQALPEIPAVTEYVPGYEASVWYGVGVPKKTPADIIGRLNKEINAGLADPMLKAQLADLGGEVLAGSPAEFGKLIVEEIKKWAKVIRTTNIKAE
jgi:tripartite-type tricarboxylate transporter receptor subunit TctC